MSLIFASPWVLFALAGRCGGWNGIILLSAALTASPQS